MKSGTLFDELFEAAKTVGMKPPIPTDKEHDYLTALTASLDKIGATEWDNLSVDGQNWYNKSVILINGLNPPPPLDGFRRTKAEIIADEETKNITNPPSTKQITEGFDAGKTTSPNVAPRRAASGVLDAMRRLVLLHPDWSARQVFTYLKENGWPAANMNTVTVEVGNTKRVMEIADKLGLLKENKKDEAIEEIAAPNTAK